MTPSSERLNIKIKRPYKAADDTKSAADEILSLMPAQGKRQWGNAVKSFWFYDSDLCPGRMAPPVGTMKIKGEQGLPINAFIHRPRGVLIGYFLCGKCAGFIHSEAAKNPFKQTPLHADIEKNLIDAYNRHLMSLDA
jgi:hypothetical protein